MVTTEITVKGNELFKVPSGLYLNTRDRHTASAGTD